MGMRKRKRTRNFKLFKSLIFTFVYFLLKKQFFFETDQDSTTLLAHLKKLILDHMQ